MKTLKPASNQGGFIPMMICVIGFILLVIILVYMRVSHVNGL